ncbi:MAG: GTP-binding protein [Pseudomonadota bacterium]|nr:GTP-binding protein [Pseudomonadota bacterium]
MDAAREATRARLPLTVIGGFLGAGKTTLLNRLLRDSAGRRLAVLVNDFGALNIDAELIAASAGDTIALTNGCVCCSIGDDLTAALIRVIEAPLPFDAVVIEASGVSDPWRIAQVGLADPGLGLDGVIVLVDAGACLAHAGDPLLADSLQRQLEAADLLIVNKSDLVDATGLQEVRDWLALAAPGTPRFETSQARVPMALLSGAALSIDGQAHAQGGDHDHDHDHDHGRDDATSAQHGEDFETWSCRPARVFAASALRALLREMPAGVLRLKGIVRSDEHGWAELQFAGRHGSLRKALAAPAAGAAVVAVGLRGRLPAQTLESVLCY